MSDEPKAGEWWWCELNDASARAPIPLCRDPERGDWHDYYGLGYSVVNPLRRIPSADELAALERELAHERACHREQRLLAAERARGWEKLRCQLDEARDAIGRVRRMLVVVRREWVLASDVLAAIEGDDRDQ